MAFPIGYASEVAVFVSAGWLEERLDSPEILVLDPRRPVAYMKGHLKNAVNLPASRAMDPQGGLADVNHLEAWAGAAGVDDRKTPVVYDAYDGRNAALLAWIFEYLGRADVHLLDIFLERWIAEGREIFYRPVKPRPAQFAAQVRDSERATLEDVRGANAWKLVDFRSPEEYSGKVDTDGKPGHIPGAANLDWRELVGAKKFLAPPEKLERLLAAAKVGPEEKVVAYCRTGVRAALGYLALKQLGRRVRLYDGSFREWARNGLPVEKERR